MSWTHLLSLGIGLGVGTLGTQLLTRSRPPSSLLPCAKPIASPSESATQLQSARLFLMEPGEQPATDLFHPPIAERPAVMTEQLQRLQLAYEMAIDLARFKAGFLARTSHELRSPINSVISLHQLILSDLCESPEEEREFVAQASTAAQKMLTVLDQLIKISKAEHGNDELQIQPLQLHDVLAEIQEFTQLQAQNRNLRLSIELPDPSVYVLADPRWLRQVLINLVDTPVSQMQEGTIHLTTEVDSAAQHVHLLIEDDRPISVWQEGIQLLTALNASSASTAVSGNGSLPSQSDRPAEAVSFPSSGLTLLTARTLLELMGGRLTVLAPGLDHLETIAATPAAIPEATAALRTRIQCSIPLFPA